MIKLKQKRIKLKVGASKHTKNITIKHYKLPNGMIDSFITSDEPSSVVIFPITTDNQVYMVRQYRPGSESEELELPGGAINLGEDLITAAKRELKEETGLIAKQMIYLGSITYNPYSSGVKNMFIALNCVPTGKLDLDDNEFLSVEVYSLEETRKLMKNAKFRGYDVAYMGFDYLKELNFNF